MNQITLKVACYICMHLISFRQKCLAAWQPSLKRDRPEFDATRRFSFLFVLLSYSLLFLYSQFSLRAAFMGMWKAAAIKACIVPGQSSREKTHIVIHINFQLFCLGSNGEVPFVWTSSQPSKKRGCKCSPRNFTWFSNSSSNWVKRFRLQNESVIKWTIWAPGKLLCGNYSLSSSMHTQTVLAVRPKH